MSYQDFLASKRATAQPSGIAVDPSTLNPTLFPWQRDIVAWSLRRGRTAIFADCGLGKTFMQLEYAAALHRAGVRRALIACPLSVSEQTLREAGKFNIDCPVRIVADQSQVRDGINITNYEKLHKFDLSVFSVIVPDEASLMKEFAGKVTRQLIDWFSRTPYRLPCTATPAPNDYMELGTQCEFLGAMQRAVMLSKYFIHDGGDTSQWRLRRHGREDFWRWVSTWAVSVSKPSDLGYSDAGFDLPPLEIVEHVIAGAHAAGTLFGLARSVNATNVHVEKRAGLKAKAEGIAAIVNAHKNPCVVWVDTNYEADAVRPLIPDAVEVRGSGKEAVKAERLTAFARGEIRVLISKSEIAGFGSNWQHCRETHCMANFSFERWYQLIRRFWRFGQTEKVTCHLWSSEAEQNVVATLKRKQADYSTMVGEMCRSMQAGMRSELYGAVPLKKYAPDVPVRLPSWLSGARARTSEAA